MAQTPPPKTPHKNTIPTNSLPEHDDSPNALAGMTVLVVEDTALIAEFIAEHLYACGCDVVGPAARLPAGLKFAGEEELDGALLDINLAGEFCFPIADTLDARGIPFVFLTGYHDMATLPPRHQAKPRLGKPFNLARLESLVAGFRLGAAPKSP